MFWFPKSNLVTLWRRWPQVTPLHWHKFSEVVLFHELVKPSGSSWSCDFMASSAMRSISFDLAAEKLWELSNKLMKQYHINMAKLLMEMEVSMFFYLNVMCGSGMDMVVSSLCEGFKLKFCGDRSRTHQTRYWETLSAPGITKVTKIQKQSWPCSIPSPLNWQVVGFTLDYMGKLMLASKLVEHWINDC